MKTPPVIAMAFGRLCTAVTQRRVAEVIGVDDSNMTRRMKGDTPFSVADVLTSGHHFSSSRDPDVKEAGREFVREVAVACGAVGVTWDEPEVSTDVREGSAADHAIQCIRDAASLFEIATANGVGHLRPAELRKFSAALHRHVGWAATVATYLDGELDQFDSRQERARVNETRSSLRETPVARER